MPSKALVPLTPGAPPAWPQVPFPQQQERRSEAAIVTIARWARRNRHLTVPLAVPPGLWLTGLIMHRAHPELRVLAAGVLLTAAACVWIFAPHKWTDGSGKPRVGEVWYARLTVALAALWLIAAAWIGPLGGFIASISEGASLLAFGIAWGYFWWRHKRPRGQRQQERLLVACDAWWQSHCWNWNLHGSRVIEADLKGVTLRIRVKGIGGRHTLQHFRQVIPLIESAAEGQADIGMVRVQPVRGRPSEVDIFLKQENPLRGVVEYDPAIAPQSVHDPSPFGRQETGGWRMTAMRQNRFTIGMTRWGKSNDLLVAVANLSGCPDGRFILIDLKGGRSARPVLKSGVAEYVVTEVDEARMTLRMTVAEGKAREMYAYDGHEQLHATEAVPALFTMIDEIRGLTATEDGVGDPESRRHVATVASQGNGVEEYVWIYTQHGSLESSVGTEQIRANLPWRTCYRVAEARHGAYCIPEYNQLDASRLEEKGTCYIKDGPDADPEQIRTPLMEHALLERVAAQNAALLGPRQPLRLYCGEQVAYETADGPVTWQQWWDARWLRLHEAFRDDSPQYQAAALTADPARPVTPAPSPSAPVPADASPVSRLPAGFTPDPRLVDRLPAELAGQEDRFCAALQAATADSPVTPKDLMTISGRAKTWVHDQLGAMLEIGCITLVSRGRYALMPGSDIRAGLREIRERNERVGREAREMVNAA